ncbi:SAC3/GANP family protein, partial [Teladorsagia circumcincta]
EYARSAADQDNPLPHELRSEDLLKNTMDYLLKHVVDSLPGSEDDLATWYDFLWSRTRAIRKEITQLMLTDATAIALFERCARLHILCAYKLCRLGFDRFDQNMNTENLAKCLQSLRHLYEDLELQGKTFDTEAEFRGYDVMLHLHDSNIMRQ